MYGLELQAIAPAAVGGAPAERRLRLVLGAARRCDDRDDPAGTRALRNRELLAQLRRRAPDHRRDREPEARPVDAADVTSVDGATYERHAADRGARHRQELRPHQRPEQRQLPAPAGPGARAARRQRRRQRRRSRSTGLFPPDQGQIRGGRVRQLQLAARRTTRASPPSTRTSRSST